MKPCNFETLNLLKSENMKMLTFGILKLGNFETSECFLFSFKGIPPPLNIPTPTPAPAPSWGTRVVLEDTSGLGGHVFCNCVHFELSVSGRTARRCVAHHSYLIGLGQVVCLLSSSSSSSRISEYAEPRYRKHVEP